MFMFSGEMLGKNAVSWYLLVFWCQSLAQLRSYLDIFHKKPYDTGRYSGPISRCLVIVTMVLKWALLWTAIVCWLITRLAAVFF